jgi:ligand-binding sensor domain-containing protein/signal transduction histidine kinase/DNA-binding response OmpR family regulator
MIGVKATYHMRRRTVMLVAILAGIFDYTATGQRIAFTHLNVENGLSQNSVLAITQDSRGFMWYGNRFGLNRYDGHHFKLYKSSDTDSSIPSKNALSNNSLSNNYVVSLLSDLAHNLWVGTADGLNRYDPEKDNFERILLNPAAPSGQDNYINCLYEDRKGDIWAGTAHGLFCRTTHGASRFIPFYTGAATPASGGPAQGIAGNNVHAIYEDQEGYLWIGTNNGLTRMRMNNNGAYEYQTFRHGAAGSISDNFVNAIQEDNTNQHNLWIGTLNGGLNRYDRAAGTFAVFKHDHAGPSGLINNNIRKITTDKEGKLWIGTQEGLSILDPVSGDWHSYQHDPGNRQSLSQNSIYSIYRDANGSMWIGTYFGGVNITYSYTTPFTIYESTPYHSSISNNVISAITEDRKHNLWIGTEGGGLNYFNRTTGIFTIFKNKINDPSSLGSNLVKTVYQDREGDIWVGTHGGGLNLFDPIHLQFKHLLYKENDPETLGSEITAIIEDSSGRLWIGSQTGLKIFTKMHKGLIPWQGNIDLQTMHDKSIKVLYEDSKKNIWVSTTAGLFRLENGSRSFERILNNKENNSVNTDFINCIQEDSKGHIWIGVYYEGLAMYDVITKSMVSYTEKDGLPNNNVMGILEDNSGSLWLSTDNGLSRFDSNRKFFKNYTASDGLTSNEFNYNSYFKDSRGEMFFGGYNGFISFFPDKIETNNYIAPVVFTSLKLFNDQVGIGGRDGLLEKDISLTHSITLRYDQNIFTLDFALLNYIKSNKNKYACKLEGFDKNWNDVNVASVTYTSLPSGDYTLLVKGANNDGVWSQPVSLQIKILPPFWRTWWAYGVYAMASLLLVFFITRFFFLRELLKREDALHQAKLNFFTNISHEIRTHLALIIGPVEKLLMNKKDDEDARQLSTIKKNSESLLQLVSELMDFRKAESGHLPLHASRENIVAFVRDIYLSFLNLAATRHIKADFIASDNDIEIYFDREQLEKVFFNLLSNAFKFTPDGGMISILIENKKPGVEIRVIDNGKGIAPENLEKLFLNYYQENDDDTQNTGYGIGLALSHSIVELHGGTLQVESVDIPASDSADGTDPAGNRTCFTVTLPAGKTHFSENQLLPETQRTTPEETKPVVESTSQESSHGQITQINNSISLSDRKHSILLVEDNPELRTFIRDTLEGNYQVIETANGIRGWESAIENIPDLIISDVMMPEMDGFELCRRLKTDERTSHIPVILLTAKTSTDHQVNGLQQGADIYLTKPFSIPVLELHIRNLLVSRETMRQKFSSEFTLQPKNIVINTIDEQFLNKAIQVIEDNMEDPAFGVQVLSTNMTMSQPVLYKKIKALTDMSVNDFIKSIRLKKASQLLQQGGLTIYEIAYMVGYSDRKYFSKEFKKQFGSTPSEYSSSSSM